MFANMATRHKLPTTSDEIMQLLQRSDHEQSHQGEDEEDPHQQHDDSSLGIEHILIPGVVFNQGQVSGPT